MTGRRRWGSDALPWVIIALLLVLRVPSLVQPLGPDQSLYAYVAQEIDRGGWPYLDAWDQKPPGIHLTYAAWLAVWPDDTVIALADLVASGLIALLLVPLGPWWSDGRRSAGFISACVFLLLGDPAWQRLGGLRVRSQCEVFIALAVTASVWLAVRQRRRVAPSPWLAAGAGLLVGYAALLKYPAALYGLVPLVVMIWPRDDAETPSADRWRNVAILAGCAAILPLLTIALYWSVGGLQDLVDATVMYNLTYSGATYTGPLDFVRYLAWFPIQHARVDGLWLLGGAGAIVLLTRLQREPRTLVLFLWLLCAMVAIAINGSRGLPQYFLQAGPAWALAAGVGASIVVSNLRRVGRVALMLVAVVAVWRVVEVDNLARALVRDTRMMTGEMTYDAYIGSFGERRADKFRLASTVALARMLEQHSKATDRVFVFGFAPAAYVYAQRQSASRFFWSAPVTDGFNRGRPGYGPEGLLADLVRHRPAVVAIQTEPADLARGFWQHPALSTWLKTHYTQAPATDAFDIWLPRQAAVP